MSTKPPETPAPQPSPAGDAPPPPDAAAPLLPTDAASPPTAAPPPPPQPAGPAPAPQPPGCLMVCSTPIGNLGDITSRVAKALADADCILAEDTRVTAKLLRHLGLSTPIERCDENIIRARIPGIVERIAAGQRLALVTDSGTPAVSDPGAALVAAVRAAGLAVEVLPGPSAVLAALVASGFNAPGFYFGGFLPRKPQARRTLLTQTADLPATLIFYESPHRTLAALADIAAALPGRRVAIARELTKLHEEVLIDTADALIHILEEREQASRPLRGELVLLIEPPSKPAQKEHVDKYANC